MLFNSIAFAIFFPLVFFLYWFVARNNLRAQNILLMVASYYFYSCWDWRFVFLLAFSTFLDYYSGIKIHDSGSEKKRKFWLVLSVAINLGFLGFFKYYNFFIDSFVTLLESFGFRAHISTLNIILPVGISFYTFHGLSYVFDIYYRRITPSRDIVNYSLFVSFFPLLVAGPIERATHLLPQVESKRFFSYEKGVDGMKQILWGLFKKIVIADGCAEYADLIFNNSESYSGSTLALGALLFAFQIYGDFSGYSDIALGTARLLGFELLRNFAFPYFSRDIAEFWRRWHISLSSWFRDYVYIPLGGSRVGTWKKIRNTFIIFLISGFWHGANWTFVIWGALNAIYILPLITMNLNRNNLETVAQGKLLPNPKELFSMALTFALTVFAWIFFRAESVEHAFRFVGGMFSKSLFSLPSVLPKTILFLLVVFIIVEWMGRESKYAIEHIGARWPRILRWSIYASILFGIGMYMQTKETAFIYFQF